MKKVVKKFILNELSSSKVKTCEKCENSSGKELKRKKKIQINENFVLNSFLRKPFIQ